MLRSSPACLLLLAALAAAPARAAELAVEWAPSKAVDGYVVERRVDEPKEPYRAFARVAKDNTRLVDRSVLPGVRYCYRVRGARGQQTSAPSAPLCGIALPPEPALEAPRLASVTPVVERATESVPEEVVVAEVARPVEAPTESVRVETIATPEPAQAAPTLVATTVPVEPPAQEPAPQPAEARPPAPEPAIDVAAAAPANPATPGDHDVRALHRPPPRFPGRALLEGREGWVKLRFTVTAEGTTKDINVVASSPVGLFEEAAIDAARRFSYLPRVERGVAVDRPGVETEITFSIVSSGRLSSGNRSQGRP